VIHPTSSLGSQIFSDFDSTLRGSESVVNFRKSALGAALKYATEFLGSVPAEHQAASLSKASSDDYPYFNFIPADHGAAFVNGAPVAWQGDCFQDNTAQLTKNGPGDYTFTVTVGKPSSLLCQDFYLFGTVEGFLVHTFFWAGTSTFDWKLNANYAAAEEWDIETKGIRVFRFHHDPLTTLRYVVETVLLFEGEFTQGISDRAAVRNLDFMAKYPQKKMYPRATQDVELDESLISSGDFFGIIRLDGLDPMLAWAMGSTTGHTTVALWIDGELYICESTTKDSYWPTNGIQKTPYKTWVAQAKAAGYNTVHIPLNAAARAAFNESAALEFFGTVEGLDYGFYNLLLGWIDTPEQNYVCLPPDYTNCLTYNIVEILFALGDKIMPSIADIVFKQAWGLRVNAAPTDSYPEILHKFGLQNPNLNPNALPAMVESDDYLYQTTRYNQTVMGKSMVCCVFVCNMWKAGGLFASINNQVNCAELTNWDDYSLTILEPPATRPPQCVAADPNNQLCQIGGAYTLELNDLHSKDMYPHIAENCPTIPPLYTKPPTC